MALIFFPGFMNGELDTNALHAGMPAIDVKWVSQVWIRQSQRADGQPSVAVPIEEQTLIGPLHEGVYVGRGASQCGHALRPRSSACTAASLARPCSAAVAATSSSVAHTREQKKHTQRSALSTLSRKPMW